MKKGNSVFLLVLTAIVVAVLAVACFMSFPISATKDYNSIMSLIGQGIDLSGGYYVVLTPEDTGDSNQNVIEEAQTILRTRLDNKGYTEAVITVQDGDKIRVEIPNVNNDDQVLEVIGSTGVIEFRDYQNVVWLSGDDIKSAYVGSEDGNYVVVMNFSESGVSKFSQATATVSSYSDNKLYIYLGDEIVSQPQVKEQITNQSAQIEGSFTYEEAESLAAVIDSGRLPIEYKVSEQRSISPRLGETAVSKSLIAGGIGLLIIFIIMIVYYGGMGIAADIALTLYTLLYIIFLAIVPGVQLTLPGIAGILLSIGMAVDANIVIFERIKREFASGKTVISSIDAGFKQAVITVIDANVTTILAAVVLYFLTTGAIKGFAITLLIGVALSMVTSIFVTRWYLKILLGIPENKGKFFNLKKQEGSDNV